MTKIYIVTEGDYSDYHICGVFDDENLANLFAEKFGGDVETHELNPAEVLITEGYNIYNIQMDKDGNTKECNMQNTWYNIEELNDTVKVGFNYRISPIWDRGKQKWDRDNLVLYTYILAKNPEHAIKIANERRIRLISEDLWK